MWKTEYHTYYLDDLDIVSASVGDKRIHVHFDSHREGIKGGLVISHHQAATLLRELQRIVGDAQNAAIALGGKEAPCTCK